MVFIPILNGRTIFIGLFVGAVVVVDDAIDDNGAIDLVNVVVVTVETKFLISGKIN